MADNQVMNSIAAIAISYINAQAEVSICSIKADRDVAIVEAQEETKRFIAEQETIREQFRLKAKLISQIHTERMQRIDVALQRDAANQKECLEMLKGVLIGNRNISEIEYKVCLELINCIRSNSNVKNMIEVLNDNIDYISDSELSSYIQEYKYLSSGNNQICIESKD